MPESPRQAAESNKLVLALDPKYLMRFALRWFVLLLLLTPAWCASSPGFLPTVFSGWQQDAASVKTSRKPGEADPTNAAVLKEYGLSDFESANYTKDNDRKLTVRAIRFEDATGAYGAYTLYSQPGMQTEEIGRHGESDNDRVLFMQGNIVVEAKFDRVNEMSAAEMRELAGDLPEPTGSSGQPPNLARWLPHPVFIEHSVKYAVGPKSYEVTGAPLPPTNIDFSKSPEILTALYKSDEGNAKLTLISYPTPQIAGAQLRIIEQSHAALQAAGVGDFLIKRTGPLLVLVSGDASQSEAKSLLGSVSYEANVTFDEPTFLGKKNNIGNLIVAVFGLIGLILAVAIVLGVAFGGIRVLLKRFYPDRFIDRPEDMAVITLNLRDNPPKSP